MKNKPRIIYKMVRDKDEIVELLIKDKVKKLGGTGYVAIPRSLIGKYVMITYRK